MKQYLIKWLVQSITGLVLTGAGLSISIDAGLHKLRGLSWFWQGTLGLILFQAGICLMIDSLVAKMRVKKILK
jgi:NAD-dependent SIR2 family protein deacetylase